MKKELPKVKPAQDSFLKAQDLLQAKQNQTKLTKSKDEKKHDNKKKKKAKTFEEKE